GFVFDSGPSYELLTFPLDRFGGQTVRFRFLFESFGPSNALGWFIDDLKVSGLKTAAVIDFLDPAADADRDGLTNAEEVARGTDPQNKDTDGDGLPDAAETGTGVFTDAGHTGTQPANPDTDGGGESDGDEVKAGRNPLDPLDDQIPLGFNDLFDGIRLKDGAGNEWQVDGLGSASLPRDDVFAHLGLLG